MSICRLCQGRRVVKTQGTAIACKAKLTNQPISRCSDDGDPRESQLRFFYVLPRPKSGPLNWNLGTHKSAPLNGKPRQTYAFKSLVCLSNLSRKRRVVKTQGTAVVCKAKLTNPFYDVRTTETQGVPDSKLKMVQHNRNWEGDGIWRIRHTIH